MSSTESNRKAADASTNAGSSGGDAIAHTMFKNEGLAPAALFTPRKRPRGAPEELKEMFRDKVEQRHKRRKLANKKRFKSKKLRKIGAKMLTEERRKALGEKRNSTNGETLEQLVEMVLRNSDTSDPKALAAEIRAAHAETTEACRQFDEVMGPIFQAGDKVIKYSGILKRSMNKQMGGTHLLINLSNALRNTIGFCEKASGEWRAVQECYFSLLARVEAMSRTSLSGRAAVNNSETVKLQSALVATNLAAPEEHMTGARWAVRTGTGDVVELRSVGTRADARPAESYLSCSIARSSHLPSERAEGSLYQAQMKRASAKAKSERRPVRALLQRQSLALTGANRKLSIKSNNDRSTPTTTTTTKQLTF